MPKAPVHENREPAARKVEIGPPQHTGRVVRPTSDAVCAKDVRDAEFGRPIPLTCDESHALGPQSGREWIDASHLLNAPRRGRARKVKVGHLQVRVLLPEHQGSLV